MPGWGDQTQLVPHRHARTDRIADVPMDPAGMQASAAASGRDVEVGEIEPPQWQRMQGGRRLVAGDQAGLTAA
jgi:hypothetical protein